MKKREGSLSHELKVYDQKKSEWLPEHQDEFVVIFQDEIEGFYPDYKAAFSAGIKKFGVERQFLIKQVCPSEPVYVVY